MPNNTDRGPTRKSAIFRIDDPEIYEALSEQDVLPENILKFGKELGYKAVIRPAFTLGGAATGISDNEKEFKEGVKSGILASPVNEVRIEEVQTEEDTP